MKVVLCLILLLEFLLVDCLQLQSAIPATAHEQFFTSASGFWSGIPSATPTGPWLSALNLTITKTTPPVGGEPKWVLVHNLDGFAVSNSTQQFWSNYDNTTRSGNLTYCARISSWTKPVSPSMVNLPFQLVSVSNTSIHWTFNNPPYPFTGDWTITLLSPRPSSSNESSSSPVQLKSTMMLGGATHFEAVLTLQPEKRADAQEIVVLDNCPLDVKMKEKKGDDETNNRIKPNNKPLCPLGFTKGTPPAFVQEKIRARQELEANKAATIRSPTTTAQYAAPNGKSYENCFLVNPAMNLRIRWNWIHGGGLLEERSLNRISSSSKSKKKGLLGHINPNSSVEVLVSATISSPSDYVAIGFYPEWPAMKGMDIALGFVHSTTGQGCVQSLYAKEHLGQPVANDKQKLENATSWLQTDSATGETTIWMQFSRKVDSGYRSLDWWYFPFFNLGEELAFAQGSVYSFDKAGGNDEPLPSSSFCSNSVPSYHGTGKRGVRGFDWGNPQNIPGYMKCDRN